MIVHLPPPAIWRAAQERAKACGLWLDLTTDGVYHVFQTDDNAERGQSVDFAGALALLRQIERGHTAYQLELFAA